MADFKFTLQGVPVSLEEFDEVCKYNVEMKGAPIPGELVEAAKELLDKAPEPQNEREKAIYDSGYKVGFAMAMADEELWWKLRNLRHRKAAADVKTKETSARDSKLGRRYDELRKDLDDLHTRKTLAEEFGRGLSYINKLLKKLGKH